MAKMIDYVCLTCGDLQDCEDFGADGISCKNPECHLHSVKIKSIPGRAAMLRFHNIDLSIKKREHPVKPAEPEILSLF